MSNTKRLIFTEPRGYDDSVIAVGSTVEVAEPWASRFLLDGSAYESEASAEIPAEENAEAKKKNVRSKPKGKS